MTNPNHAPERTDPGLPEDDDPVDRRLTDLEVKASFTEDTLDQLNQVVVRQQEQIDLLVRELKRLRDETRKAGEVGGLSEPGVAADERPPHY